MLKGLNPLLTPDLLHLVAAMGHGDVLAVVDRNYPAYSSAPRIVHGATSSTTELAEALFSVLPIDDFIDEPIHRMRPVDDTALTASQLEFLSAAVQAEGRELTLADLSRQDFYDRARAAFGVVTTLDPRPYSCFLVVKGVVR